MAKRKLFTKRRIQRVKSYAKRTGRGLGSLAGSVVNAAVSGGVYAIGMVASSYIPLGIDARIKRLLTLALMYLVGGVFRKAALVGVAIETAMFIGPYVGQLLPNAQGSGQPGINMALY